MKVINTGNADHYDWGGGSQGWRLLNGADLSVIQERIPPGLGEINHYHRKARQLFYVLGGVLAIDTDRGSVRLAQGDAAEVPPCLAHRVWNPGDKDVSFLIVSAPTTHGDRVNVDAGEPFTIG